MDWIFSVGKVKSWIKSLQDRIKALEVAVGLGVPPDLTLTVADDLVMTAGSDVTITATADDISLLAPAGDIVATADVDATITATTGLLRLEASAGDVEIYGDTTAGIESGGSVSIDAGTTVAIEATTTFAVIGGTGVTIESTTNDVSINVVDGDLILSPAVNFTATASTGDVTITSTAGDVDIVATAVGGRVNVDGAKLRLNALALLLENAAAYADDAAAAVGGINVGALYIHTDGFIHTRLA